LLGGGGLALFVFVFFFVRSLFNSSKTKKK
jgi:hypothetical protein